MYSCIRLHTLTISLQSLNKRQWLQFTVGLSDKMNTVTSYRFPVLFKTPPNYARILTPSFNLPSDQHLLNGTKVSTSWQAEYVQYLQSHPWVFTFKQAATITRLDSEAWSSDPGLKLDHEVNWRCWGVSVYSIQLEDDDDHDEAKMKHWRTRSH